MSKQPIFICIQSEYVDYNKLSGKYYFLCIKNNAAAFVREEGNIEKCNAHPYYLAFYDTAYTKTWFIQSSDCFDKNRTEGWIYIDTKG